MGTNAAFPPFEFIGGATGEEVVGFDVEIAKAIAKKAGAELKIQDMECWVSEKDNSVELISDMLLRHVTAARLFLTRFCAMQSQNAFLTWSAAAASSILPRNPQENA